MTVPLAWAALSTWRTGMIVLALLVMTGAAQAQAAHVAIPECTRADSLDQDRDGLSDTCELTIARRFAPLLVVRASGCNWEGAADRGRLGGGYMFVVQPRDSIVRIAYLPAYLRDCGWSGVKCWLPAVNCRPHNGDSEFIVVDVAPEPARPAWSVRRIFLSAHCFGRTSGSCRWYEQNDLNQFEWAGAAPVVWVAEGRNANYPSQQSCDGGHHSVDTCDHHNFRYQFPIIAEHNLGSRARPSRPDGCFTGAAAGVIGGDPARSECFWRPNSLFRGWLGEGPGVTDYSRYLKDIAGF